MGSDLLLVLPLLLPLYGTVLCLLAWHHVRVQIVISGVVQVVWLAATALLLSHVLAQGISSTRIGDWPAPFSIVFVADLTSALMLVAAAVIGVAVYGFSIKNLDYTRKRFGYYPLLLLLQMGVAGVCLTGDIFNLYVWFEVILICCIALLVLGGTRLQLEGTLKYLTINLVASGLLLTGVALVYTLYGSLNLAVLSQMVRQPDQPNLKLLSMTSVFFLTGFGIKSAIFPLFFWLPASYHTPPIAISAFVAGLITKIGIYTLIRLFTLVFVSDLSFLLPLLAVLSGFTMVVGVVGAAAQMDFRKILSFHIISQIGYMLMGLAIYTPLALAGSIYFILHNILVKTNLFLISGAVAAHYRTFALKKLGGAYLKFPVLSGLFMVSAMALAGIPPLSGFWGKYMLAKAGFENGNYLLVLVSIGVSLITLFSMTKIWNEVFWKNRKENQHELTPAESAAVPSAAYLYLPIIFLTVAIMCISLYAQPLIEVMQKAAHQLLHTKGYVNAVLRE